MTYFVSSKLEGYFRLTSPRALKSHLLHAFLDKYVLREEFHKYTWRCLGKISTFLTYLQYTSRMLTYLEKLKIVLFGIYRHIISNSSVVVYVDMYSIGP